MLTGETLLFPLLADPARHVKAPAIFQPAFEARGLDWFLFPLNVRQENFEAAFAQLRLMGNVGGCVVSVPFKARAARLCDRLGPLAQKGGVVNTVRFADDGTVEGEILDGVGLILCAAETGIRLEGANILMLGAGGAASAIAHALADKGIGSLTVQNRSADRARALVASVREHRPDYPIDIGSFDATRHDVVINATSLGISADDPAPMDVAQLKPSTSVIDIVVPDTALRRAAQALGCKVTGGRPMVAAQIAAQIALWKGEIATSTNLIHR
ncbi:shikimate dehydrogenase family protein [Piscinibacter sakaiensis]|uniref:shikimate dehydrogenase family protein n=1 Tax=Piscinibacter sakaiensis TaxID=1547922 RepID=UPI003AAF621E